MKKTVTTTIDFKNTGVRDGGYNWVSASGIVNLGMWCMLEDSIQDREREANRIMWE